MSAITQWLDPLRSILDPAADIDWPRLHDLDGQLDTVLAAHPVGADVPAGPERSRRLLLIRRALATGELETSGVFQLLAQFVCGYRDLDLRDATGLGHGRLIAEHGTPESRQHWLSRLRDGELTGVAITEPHGGSQVVTTRTRAVRAPGGIWEVTGRKTWISRLHEASVFVVFFRDPDGRLAAAAVDATQPGLHRRSIPPTGLAGWTWGILDLDAVPVRPDDVLTGDGMTLLRDHFACYRPLVTATALGGAAAVFDTVTEALAERQSTGEIARLRDSALVTIGRCHAQLATALLGATIASHLAAGGHDQAEVWAAATKAHGIDTAHHAVHELALLLGATAFQADSHIAKTRRDLNGLLYADGIHDSLYRTAGKHHTTPNAAIPGPRTNREPAPVTA